MNDFDPAGLAAQWGIETGYFDVQGRRCAADPETLKKIAEALSFGGNSPGPAPESPGHPRQAYQGDGRKCWVLAVQLYGVRSTRNWGHGDFGDLRKLLDVVADKGGAGVGLNPLHALFYDRAGVSGSPYAPNSRLFLNPLYIDVEALPEFQNTSAEFRNDIERLRHTEFIDYPAVARLKIEALRSVFQHFQANASAERRADFQAFKHERGRELQCFSAFEALREEFPEVWWTWPDEWRAPTDTTLRRLVETRLDAMEFHGFLQWNAGRQLESCHELAQQRGMAIGLYLDTAIGTDASGADAWMAQGAMLRGLSVGAPPDQFNPAGQDWGLTAYNPHGLVQSHFEPFRQMLRAAMRSAGAVRIDHVLGLMRLYLIPHGAPASEGAYLALPFENMLAVAAEESERSRCIVIGEDLGTVPEGFRAKLLAWGLWSYLVVMFERHGDGSFKPPREYPVHAIATFNTHDLATFAGWMSGHDLRAKRAIGVDPGESDADRARSHHELRTVLGRGQPSFDDIAGFLAATPTRLVSIAVEDIFGVEDQVNVPGTLDQHPNWRRRWPVPLEQLASDQRLCRIASAFARAGRGSAS